MPRLLGFSLVSVRDLLTTYGPVLVLVGVLIWVAFVAIDPTPPTTVVIATGVENSAYEDFAKRYKAILARHHIDVELRPSAGSMQNLHRLSTPHSDADVAFVQSGTTNDEVAERRGLVSLGSLFVEPVWIFYREAALSKVKAWPLDHVTPPSVRKSAVSGIEPPALTAITQLREMRGLSLNVGPKGSGGPRLAHQLLAANRSGSRI